MKTLRPDSKFPGRLVAGVLIVVAVSLCHSVQESVGHLAPAPAFFLSAAQALGAAPAATLMFGDDPMSDVGGAQAAGLRGGLVLTGKTSRDEVPGLEVTPDIVLEEIDDLVELL